MANGKIMSLDLNYQQCEVFVIPCERFDMESLKHIQIFEYRTVHNQIFIIEQSSNIKLDVIQYLHRTLHYSIWSHFLHIKHVYHHQTVHYSVWMH
jgi:hypothetical protein